MNFPLPELTGLVDSVPAESLPEVIGALEAAKARAWARLATDDGHERHHCKDDDDAHHGGDDDLLDDQAVGQMLAVPASHVADLRKRGALPEVRVGGKYVRVRRGDVRDYVQRQRRPLP